MKLEENEYTTASFIAYLTQEYKLKITGEEFNKNDIAQYIMRGMTPYRYGGLKLSAKKQHGVRIIVVGVEKKVKKKTK